MLFNGAGDTACIPPCKKENRFKDIGHVYKHLSADEGGEGGEDDHYSTYVIKDDNDYIHIYTEKYMDQSKYHIMQHMSFLCNEVVLLHLVYLLAVAVCTCAFVRLAHQSQNILLDIFYIKYMMHAL